MFKMRVNEKKKNEVKNFVFVQKTGNSRETLVKLGHMIFVTVLEMIECVNFTLCDELLQRCL